MTLQKGDEFIPYLLKDSGSVLSKVQQLVDNNIISRIWEKDHTVWSESPEEISNRLGWLDSPFVMREAIEEINSFVDEVRQSRFKKALLLGMGGSSLAPEVFRLTFGVREGYLNLGVLDSTHPEAVKNAAEQFDPAETLYIVSTKSGGTVETISFMKYFFTEAEKKLGEHTPKHFVAITDPGSGLEEMAKSLNFRKIFLNDPNIGGRFSALSYFGMLPAALTGINISSILDRAGKAAEVSKENSLENIENNSAAVLGCIMGELAASGIDKVTFLTSPQIKYFGAWVEQLIAESTGKSGKGILPVDLETLVDAEYYGKDRLFVYLKLKNDFTYSEQFTLLREAGMPAVQITLDDLYDLGREFFNWEIATSIASWIMQIQPFDQPNVEQAKVIGKQKMNEYKESGKLEEETSSLSIDDVSVFGDAAGGTLYELITNFINNKKQDGSYVSIQAYLNPDSETNSILNELRTSIQKDFRISTTLGFGPRFLHSTGQLHKGDEGKGLFIQITDTNNTDLPIPDNAGSNESSITFDVLVTAQAMGDRQALLDNNRNVLRLHYTGSAVSDTLKNLLK